jgi:putative sterol carrier protein
MSETEPIARERVEDCLQRLEDGFRRRWENNEDFRSSLRGKDRDILIDLRATGAWCLKVRDGDLEAIEETTVEDPDVEIEADADDFVDVFDGDLGPVKAYMTGKIQVDAGMRDLMLVKKFLG